MGYSLSKYAKLSEKLYFYPPDTHTYVRVRIRGLELLVFREILRTYSSVDDPQLTSSCHRLGTHGQLICSSF